MPEVMKARVFPALRVAVLDPVLIRQMAESYMASTTAYPSHEQV